MEKELYGMSLIVQGIGSLEQFPTFIICGTKIAEGEGEKFMSDCKQVTVLLI